MGERSCGEQANQWAGDPAGFLPAGSWRQLKAYASQPKCWELRLPFFGCVVEEWATLRVLAQAFHAGSAVSPASTSLLVLTLRSKEFTSMDILSCYDARPLGRASPPQMEIAPA
jgi:hypothetical protein